VDHKRAIRERAAADQLRDPDTELVARNRAQETTEPYQQQRFHDGTLVRLGASKRPASSLYLSSIPLIEYGTADQLFHDLGRTAINALYPRVHERSGNVVLAHVAITAVQLQTTVSDAILHFGRRQLGHTHGRHIQRAGHEAAAAFVDECSVDANIGS